jgi:hypothetical protein
MKKNGLEKLRKVRKLMRLKPQAVYWNVRKTILDMIKNEDLLQEFLSDQEKMVSSLKGTRFQSILSFPCLNDKDTSPQFDRHYFYHPAWAMRVLKEVTPEKHIDISSIISFVGDLSAFIPVECYEFHAPMIDLDGVNFGSVDLTNLPFETNSIESLSCMHVVEHIGLGRYGDNVDSEGDLKAASELQRVCRLGGHLLFVAPVAECSRLEFNAHRVYTVEMVLEMFPKMRLEEFALIPDKPEQGGLVRYANFSQVKDQRYACGCFHFIKDAG